MLKDLHGRLRPMGISDILDEAAEIYKSNFVLLIGTAGVIYVPYFLLTGLVRGAGQVVPDGSMGATLLIFPLAILISSIVTGALTFAISDRYLGRPASVEGAYRRVLKREVFLPLLGATILKDLIVFGPMMALILASALLMPAFAAQGGSASTAVIGLAVLGFVVLALVWMVYLGVRLALVEPAVILEAHGAVRSLSRSWDLLKGNVTKGFWLLVIVGLLVLLIVGIVSGPTSGLIFMKAFRKEEIGRSLIVMHTLLSALVQTLVAPLSSVAVILLYYDMRIRKEGFDLELLAKELDDRARDFASRGASTLPQEQPPTEDPPNDG